MVIRATVTSGGCPRRTPAATAAPPRIAPGPTVTRILQTGFLNANRRRPPTTLVENETLLEPITFTLTRPAVRPNRRPSKSRIEIIFSHEAERPAVSVNPNVGLPLATPDSLPPEIDGAPTTRQWKKAARSARFWSSAATPLSHLPMRLGRPVIRPVDFEIDSPGGNWLP